MTNPGWVNDIFAGLMVAVAVYSAGRWTMQEDVDLDGVTRLVPFSPENNLIKNDAVLLSSEPRKS